MKNISRRNFVKTAALASAGIYLGAYMRSQFDIVIVNGQIADGFSSSLLRADLGISGGKITAVGDLSTASADTVIDAKGKIVSPGFIDIHTHTDIELLINGNGESKIRQGVTTEVSGQCGSSPFPKSPEDIEAYENDAWERYNLRPGWRDTKTFLDSFERSGISLNYVTFTGHGDLRAFVAGKNDVKASPEQLKLMQKVLRETMEAGSFGLSTGLEYSPGSYANTEELIELNKIVAASGGVYATHMRNEDDTLEEAVNEALEIAKKTGVSLQISHLKACNKANWHKINGILRQLEKEAAAGLPVTADRYPYIAYSTGLSAFLPLWSRQGNKEDVIARLQENKQLDDIKRYTEGRGERIGGWDRVVISSCRKDENKKYEGRSIAECCGEENMEASAFIADLLIKDEMGTGMVGFAMDEDNLKKVLASPHVMIGSDGNAAANYGPLSEGKPHPRYYGTFPRVLGKYSRDEKVFPIHEAVKKMTSMPAGKLGLKERGEIRKGYYADIVVFDPGRVIDKATFTDPHQYPDGIEHVIVNGAQTIKNGEHTGARKGMALRKS